jgi:hypothetical protein
MPSRQLQAEVVGASWALDVPAEQSGGATALGAGIQTLIAQLQLSAGQNSAGDPLLVSPQFAGGSERELGSVISQIAGGHLYAVTSGGEPAGRQPSSAGATTPARIGLRGITLSSSEAGQASAQGVLPFMASTTSEPLGGIRRASERHSAVADASATVRPIPVGTRPAVRAAIGTGASASAPPSFALSALLTLCLVPVLLLGRLGFDPFSFKSTLLTSRLERPG